MMEAFTHSAHSAWRRVTRRDPCSICGRGDWCTRTEDGAIACCMRVEDGSFKVARNGGYLHRLSDDVLVHPRAFDPPVEQQNDLAEPVRLDAVLRAVAHHPNAVLSVTDQNELRRRGLDAVAIRAGGYFTLPARGRARIARGVADEREVWGCPGFRWTGHNGGYLTIGAETTKPGESKRFPALAIPILTREGLWRGVQFRPHAQGTGPKYVWLSSRAARGGTASGSPPHWTPAGSDAEGLSVTEGALKGNVASHLSEQRFLCVQGVHAGQGKRVVEELQIVQWDPRKSITLYLDYGDLRKNEHVRLGLVAMGRALVAAGYDVRVASWDATKAKGVDDALFAGLAITTEPWETFVGERPVAMRPRAIGPAAAAPAYLTLEEAEEKIANLVRDLVDKRPKGLQIIQTPAGVGKTLTTLKTLAALRECGPWPHVWNRKKMRAVPLRVAIVADTTEKVTEIAAGLLAAGLREEHLAVLDGRREGNCKHHHDVRRLGECRHSPEYELCRHCPDGEVNLEGHRCPYFEQRARARSADVVAAAKEALLCSSTSDLGEFGLVVCDESFAEELLEEVRLDLAHPQAWQAELLACEDDEDDERMAPEFLPLIEVMLKTLAGGHHNGGGRNPWRPALPVLEAVATVRGIDLPAVLKKLRRMAAPKGGRYRCEDPSDWTPGVGRTLKLVMPKRALRDFAEALADELDGSERTDTRAWLETLNDTGEPGKHVRSRLHLFLPRTDLMRTLRGRTVLLLDATPEPDLPAYHAAFGAKKVTVTEFPVEEYLAVVQLSNAFRQTERVRRAIREREVARLEEGQFVVLLTRKAIAERDAAANADPRLRFGHFGAHHRAVNTFSGARTIVVEDRWAEPAEHARAVVEGWRFGSRPDADPEEYAPIEGQPVEGRRAGTTGEHPETDPDALAYAEARWGAELRQAVGRARAVRHATAEHPVRVIVESRAVVRGLPVTRVCSAWEFLGWKEPARARGRQDGAWEAQNIARRCEAEARIREAVLDHLVAQGKFPSVCQVKRFVGGRKDRIAQVLRQFSATLGGGYTPVESASGSLEQPVTTVGTVHSTYATVVTAPSRESSPPPERTREAVLTASEARPAAVAATPPPLVAPSKGTGTPVLTKTAGRAHPTRAVAVACRAGGGVAW